MAKVTEYPRITRMNDNDILLVDGPNGTRTILKNNAAKDLGGDIIAVTKSGSKDKVTLNLTDSPVDLATEKDLDDVANALLPIGTVSGNPAIVTDAKIGTTFKGLKVNIEPAQAGSGDPSQDNVRAISGWTGANIRVSPTNSQSGGQTYSIEFPSEAGTVYGGVLDLTAGTLTVEWFHLSISVVSNMYNAPQASSGKMFVLSLGSYPIGIDSTRTSEVVMLSNRFKYEVAGIDGNCYVTGSGGSLAFVIPDASVNTVALANEWLASNPTEVVYKTASPIAVYQLTPQRIAALAGYNAVFADCGPVELAYVKDVKIEEMIAEESDNTASRAFAAGEYVIVKDKLYRVTTDASAGTALVPGTNVEETTVGEELSELKTQNNPYDGLKGVAFGTSLTYKADSDNPADYGYLTHLRTLTGMTWDNQGAGSATILEYGSLPEMLSIITDYTDYSDKDICILEGFVNDWYYNATTLGTWKDTGTTTVCGCVRYALNYIFSQNANITIFLVLDHIGKNDTIDNSSLAENAGNKTQSEYYDEIAKVAESMGVHVIKEYAESEISENTSQYLRDNIHLTAKGAKQSANTIWAGMKKYLPNVVTV